MSIKPNVATEHQVIGFLSDDQFMESAGDSAIANMRQMFQRSSAASHYDNLDIKARSVICYAARLRPSDFANKRLDELTTEQREAVRNAILTLRVINESMSGICLDRSEFMSIPHRDTSSEQFKASETKRRLELSAQARALAVRAEKLASQIRKTESHGV